MNENTTEYITKFMREMPLGILRDILATLEERAIIKGAALNYTQGIRNSIDTVDAGIREVGEDVPLGTAPGFDDDLLARLFRMWFGLYIPKDTASMGGTPPVSLEGCFVAEHTEDNA